MLSYFVSLSKRTGCSILVCFLIISVSIILEEHERLSYPYERSSMDHTYKHQREKNYEAERQFCRLVMIRDCRKFRGKKKKLTVYGFSII